MKNLQTAYFQIDMSIYSAQMTMIERFELPFWVDASAKLPIPVAPVPVE